MALEFDVDVLVSDGVPAASTPSPRRVLGPVPAVLEVVGVVGRAPPVSAQDPG